MVLINLHPSGFISTFPSLNNVRGPSRNGSSQVILPSHSAPASSRCSGKKYETRRSIRSYFHQQAEEHPSTLLPLGSITFSSKNCHATKPHQFKTHPWAFVLPVKASAFAAVRFSSVGRTKGHHIQNLHLPPLTTSAFLKKLVLLIKMPWSAFFVLGKP